MLYNNIILSYWTTATVTRYKLHIVGTKYKNTEYKLIGKSEDLDHNIIQVLKHDSFSM